MEQKIVGGWSLSGISTFQDGYPLQMTANPKYGFPFGFWALRPNVSSGCSKATSGSAQSRLHGWFNNSCFSVPDAFTFGNKARSTRAARAWHQ